MSEGIDCPRAKSWMTPCIARDGSTALADDGICVGCGAKPFRLLEDLADRHPSSGQNIPLDSQEAADRLKREVKDYVEEQYAR